MSCENVLAGRPVWPDVPVYNAVIFCDLHAEPPWVYRQASFVAAACRQAGISYFTLDSNLYGDFTRNLGRARVSSIPFWTLNEEGRKGKMPRQCTFDYKIKVIEKFVRYKLLCYRPREHALPLDIHAHGLHMGIMLEEQRRARESKQTLFRNEYPLVKMGWTRADCYRYYRDRWGLETPASCCLFCPFHTNYFYRYLQEYEPDCYSLVLQMDELVERQQARPPLKSKLFLSKARKRLRDLSLTDCEDKQTFSYQEMEVWNGF